MNKRAMVQLIGMRIRQFFREPEAIFWTYGFPLIMVPNVRLSLLKIHHNHRLSKALPRSG